MTMKQRRHFTWGVAALAASCLAGAALAQTPDQTTWDRINSTKTLRVGAVAGAPPNYQKNLATGEWSGIMVDLAKDLAAKLNVKLVVTETTWGNSVLDLQTNKLDIFFGLNPTPQRREVIDFTVPLYQNAFTLIAKKGFEAKTWDELNKPEVTIAVDVGSSYDNLVTAMYDKAKILRFEKSNDATMAVQTGRADVQPLVVTVSAGILKKNPNVGPPDRARAHQGHHHQCRLAQRGRQDLADLRGQVDHRVSRRRQDEPDRAVEPRQTHGHQA